MTANKTTKKGKPYELLVKEVMAGLIELKGNGLKTTRIEHDIELEGLTALGNGKRTKHQIDVYWEFEMGPSTYKTVIQAKAWNQTIDFPMINAFRGVLIDLPGQPKGIMVTIKGFQKGVLDYAKALGIDLCILRPATPEDFTGDIPALTAELNAFHFKASCVQTAFDGNIDQHREQIEDFMRQPASKIAILDAEGHQHGSLADVFLQIQTDMAVEMNKGGISTQQKDFAYEFELARFVKPADSIGLLKIKLIRLTLNGRRLAPRINLENAFTHILQIVTGDAKYTVDKGFTVRTMEQPLTIEHVFDLSGVWDNEADGQDGMPPY
ncbi:MAG: restriction endonuclease [Candidatus Obscuribacterales bacterium]|nr:restriction endonuclease [Candidatus Obscuribacterales bacterium]